MDPKTHELVTTWREKGPRAWAQGAYGWIGEDGQPIVLTPWQDAILQVWEERRGEISTLAFSNIKKSGKTFLDAILLAWRWLALPGQHFAIGNDLDQAQARQFAMVAEMVKRHPYLSTTCKVYRNQLTFEPTGSTLTALAVDAAGNAGANHLTASHTESWGIIYEAGIRAWEEMTPPPGTFYGLPCLRIVDSYAGFEGESSTWHNLVDRGLEGKRVSDAWPIYQNGGLLLFHGTGEQAQETCYRGTPAEARAYYQEQAATLRRNAYLRMHFNQRTSGESAFLPEGAWDACYAPELRPNAEKRRLVLGADASTSRDYTALVGTCYDAATKIVQVRFVQVWRPQRGILRLGKPTIDLSETIGAKVLELHRAHQVDAVVCDPYQLHALIIDWEKAGIRVIELPQTTGRVEADQALYDAVVSRSLQHYGDPTLDEHIQNAVAIETPRGIRLAKEKTSLKIDAAVALSMSHHGALNRQKQSGQVDYMPDPWANWPPPPGAELHPVHGWVEGWNHKPHPPGVTWENCTHRNKGCYACESELEQAGVFDGLEYSREFWRSVGSQRDTNTNHQTIGEADNGTDKIRSTFWRGVWNRLARQARGDQGGAP